MTDAAVPPAKFRDYLELTKPRLSLLSVITALVGYLSARPANDVVKLLFVVVCTSLAAGGVAALNQWMECDTDARMKRTASRPLPTGKGYNLYSAKLQLPLSVTAGAPITMGYRRFDTIVTCTATCSIYATGVLTTTVNGVTASKGSYIFGGKTPVAANTPTRVAVSVWNTQISNWLKAALDKGGSATIKLTVSATGLRGEQSKAIVEAPVVKRGRQDGHGQPSSSTVTVTAPAAPVRASR